MSVYRYTVWFAKGIREYTKSGYAAAEKTFNSALFTQDLSASAGKSYMITGANSGIGKETAKALANAGATVHMVCRSKERGEEAKSEIVEVSGNQNVHLHVLDMSQPRAVGEFARNFASTSQPLNVLVNNAGCMVNTRTVTSDGLEMNFATNTLGTYILTTELIPCLQRSESPRVVTVSSGGMLLQKLDLDDLQFEKMSSFDGAMAYAQNKRQQVVMMESLANSHPHIFFATMHPGWADTPAVQTSLPDFYRRTKTILRSSQQGADTVVWLCVTSELDKGTNGGFFQDRKPVSKHLPLAWTKSSLEQEKEFMDKLKSLAQAF